MAGDLPPSSSDTRFKISGGRLDDQLADRGRSGEGDLVDVGMIGERRARRFAEARHDVDDPVRESPPPAMSSPKRRAERCLFGGFEHDRAAGGERRRQLPRGHHSGKFHGMIWPTTPTGWRSV